MEEAEATTLISAAKLHEAKLRTDVQPVPLELGIDPLYSPLLEAAESLRQKIEARNKEKIESIKRDTAEQTQNLYHKLTEAREEFKRIELTLKNKAEEVDQLNGDKQKLTQELQIANENAAIHLQEAESQKLLVENAEQNKAAEIKAIEEHNSGLIERLKAKIEQINQDFNQQIDNLQQKLSYEQQRFSAEITTLTNNNESMSEELTKLRQEQHTWQEGSSGFEEKISQLQAENTNTQLNLKDKAEKLLRTEHSLKLANEELERSQSYIKELEEKNNSLQKELFENWIHKKDEL